MTEIEQHDASRDRAPQPERPTENPTPMPQSSSRLQSFQRVGGVLGALGFVLACSGSDADGGSAGEESSSGRQVGCPDSGCSDTGGAAASGGNSSGSGGTGADPSSGGNTSEGSGGSTTGGVDTGTGGSDFGTGGDGPSSGGSGSGGLPGSGGSDPSEWPFLIGADITHTMEDEYWGATYTDGGEQKALEVILKDHGFNAARIDVFVDPTAPGGFAETEPEPFRGLAQTITLAQRVKAQEMYFLLDLHMSDTWTNPSAQSTPNAWADLSLSQL